MNNTDRPNKNVDNEKEIERLIESGELSAMTECAYGGIIADKEKNNTLNKNN